MYVCIYIYIYIYIYMYMSVTQTGSELVALGSLPVGQPRRGLAVGARGPWFAADGARALGGPGPPLGGGSTA